MAWYSCVCCSYVAGFSISQTHLGPVLADIFVGWIDGFYGFAEGLLGESVSPVLSALLLDGIIGGVGAVVGFLPLIMILFSFSHFLKTAVIWQELQL